MGEMARATLPFAKWRARNFEAVGISEMGADEAVAHCLNLGAEAISFGITLTFGTNELHMSSKARNENAAAEILASNMASIVIGSGRILPIS